MASLYCRALSLWEFWTMLSAVPNILIRGMVVTVYRGLGSMEPGVYCSEIHCNEVSVSFTEKFLATCHVLSNRWLLSHLSCGVANGISKDLIFHIPKELTVHKFILLKGRISAGSLLYRPSPFQPIRKFTTCWRLQLCCKTWSSVLILYVSRHRLDYRMRYQVECRLHTLCMEDHRGSIRI